MARRIDANHRHDGVYEIEVAAESRGLNKSLFGMLSLQASSEIDASDEIAETGRQ